MNNSLRFPADFLAEAVGKKFPPTNEQTDVIEAPMQPVLVTAGAGAGKTETMASRVVSLVANGQVRPEQVLGLTFTRKAAQQLEQRIRNSLIALKEADLFAPGSPEAQALETIAPQVSTYDSFAGELVRQFGLYLPVEPSARLITDAERYALTHEVVTNFGGRLTSTNSVDTVVQTVQDLADAMSNVLAEPEDIRWQAERIIADATELPPTKKGTDFSKVLGGMLDTQRKRIEFLDLVEQVENKQKELGVVTYGQQMSFAARLAREHLHIGEIMRSRFKVVMLDEYQDTSHAQRVLLQHLFGNKPHEGISVAAVGDPMQAIYGWRGATTENLKEFQADFPNSAGERADKMQLTTSWRNPRVVLALANHVSDSILGTGSNRAVERLTSKPAAEDGDVVLGFFKSAEEECEFVAERMSGFYHDALERGEPFSAAILVRRNRDSAEVARFLAALEVPYEIVGLGGLLWEPEIQDLVSVATMLIRPQDSVAALRVLAGPMCGIGAADIVALNKRVDNLMGLDSARISYAPGTAPLDHLHDQLRALIAEATTEAPEQILGLADAVADMGEAERYTTSGYERISELAAKLRHLRRYSLGKSLGDLFADIEASFNIRTEALARGGVTGAAHLDKFAEIVENFHGDSLGTLLDYFALARERESGLDRGEVPAAADRVLIMTVHKSKGLEFEHVSVLHADSSTYSAKSDSFLNKVEMLQGEEDVIEPEPKINSKGVEVPLKRSDYQKAAEALKEQYKEANAEESSRLFYVAMTRSEKSLSVTGSARAPQTENRSSQKDPYEPFAALKEKFPELVRVWSVEEVEDPAQSTSDEATIVATESGVFPQLETNGRVVAGADYVRAALERLPVLTSGEEFRLWENDATALLEEFHALRTPVIDVTLPYELTASDMVALKRDPVEFASRRRRPIPFKPNAYAKRGTAFHLWLEQRFGAPVLLAEDELPGIGEEKVADLERLQKKFLESQWAERTPYAVEAPFVFSIGGNLVTGRMDAVFQEPDGTWFIVDWKTGRPPKGKAMEEAAVQLAVYREGWKRFIKDGRPVRAAFHYVGENFTFEPRALATLAQMQASLVHAVNSE